MQCNSVSAPLQVGAAEVDITPPVGTHLSGDAARYRPAVKIHDPIAARVLVVRGQGPDGKQCRFCLVAMEILSIEAEKAACLRGKLEQRLGIPGEAILLHTIQNHSAPGLGHYMIRRDSPHVPAEAWWLWGCDAQYEAFLYERVLEAATTAAARLEPVDIAVSGMADGRISFNRRFILRNGRVQTQPCPHDLVNVLQAEGPADPEVGIACFRNASGKVVAALLHHTGHPVSHFKADFVSASWPGAWCRKFRRLAGDQAVPIMINGCCGNINIHNALDPTRSGHDEDISNWLMETSEKVYSRLEYKTTRTVACLRRAFGIPYGLLDENVVAAARERLAGCSGPEWTNAEHKAFNVDWIFASAIIDIAEKLSGGGDYPYEIQVFRIGDLAIAGLIGEPFVEGQLAIKHASPAGRTFVAHMCNAYVGYIPTASAWRAFNFDYLLPDGRPVRRGANLFQLHAGALDRIVAETRAMIRELFP